MALEAIMKSLDDIPEQYRDLYSQRNDQYELTGVAGVKTAADVERVQVALNKERDDHKATRAKFAPFAEWDHEEVQAKLDRYPELETLAAGGQIDEEKIEGIVQGRLKTLEAPLNRRIQELETANSELTEANTTYAQAERTRKIRDNVGAALVEAKVLDVAREDALFLAERIFEVREDDGAVVTKDGVGVTPGIKAQDWLGEIQEKRPHWWGPSEGGGAGGGSGSTVPSKNPWSAEHWNLTLQGQYLKEHGQEKAARVAKAAGSQLGAITPPAPKK